MDKELKRFVNCQILLGSVLLPVFMGQAYSEGPPSSNRMMAPKHRTAFGNKHEFSLSLEESHPKAFHFPRRPVLHPTQTSIESTRKLVQSVAGAAFLPVGALLRRRYRSINLINNTGRARANFVTIDTFN
jgi:hypothetical protein